MRKLLCLIIALAACLLVTTAVSAEETAANVPTTCAAGCENPVWTPAPATQAEWRALTPGHYHFYLTKDVSVYWRTTASADLTDHLTICLDLNGFHNNMDGRAFGIYGKTTVNIMDSSAAQTGYIKGRSGDNATVGGTVYLTGELNLYSGSLIYENDGTGSNQAYAGGVLHIGASKVTSASFNMYGGKVIGGELLANPSSSIGGGAIYLENGSMRLSGGEIISGSLQPGEKGPCIYMNNSSQITLSGTANVDDIYIGNSNAKVNIDGTYSGKARVTTSFTASDGKVIGTATNNPSITGDLMCTNGDRWNITVDGSNVKLATFTPSAARHYCQHCKDIVSWTALSSSNYTAPRDTSGTYHYYLSGKQALYIQVGNQGGTTCANLCLDLYGNTLQPASGRTILVWGKQSTLNLMDTKSGGKVNSQGGATQNNERGITISVDPGCTFNMYSGTVAFTPNGSTFCKYGVVAVGGTMNMYGGTVQGADLSNAANSAGGAIYLYKTTSALNLYGGTVTSGTVNSYAPCIYVRETGQQVKLAGSANAENIYFFDNTQHLTVSGNYTGTATITHRTMPDLGAVVGVADNATISGSLISTNGNRLVKVEGTNLITAVDAPVVVVNGETETGYNTLQEAMDACTTGYVKLLDSFSDDITVPQNVTVDLNGFELTGTITLSEGAVLYGMDSQTDDFTVEDGDGYGKVTDTAKITPAEGYLPVTEDGKVSFHKFVIDINKMTLRPKEAGIYYKSIFLGDEKVADKVESFGVALSLEDAPTTETLDINCKYSIFTDFEAGANGNASTSTLLKGILKTGNSFLKNVRNLNLDVYGRPYIKTADGYIFGQTKTRNLGQQMEDIDGIFSTLSGSQRIALLDMFEAYQPIFKGLTLTNTIAGKEKAENTLSILMVGNSFCYYYVEELYGMLMANPDPNRGYEHVEIYNLYYSGCSLTQHYNWWTTNQYKYELFRTNENGRQKQIHSSQAAWNLEDSLLEGDWDYMSLQGSTTGVNYSAGDPAANAALIMEKADPLLNRFHELFPEAQLLWHRTWSFEIGRKSTSNGQPITYDEEFLIKYDIGIQNTCDYVTTVSDQDLPFDLIEVNAGRAWTIAREENAKLETSLIPVEGGLCARKGIRNESSYPYYQGNNDAGDGYHDGDIGGGQFLNAGVWYETLTGQSILENSYKPSKAQGGYVLADEFVELLRNAIHDVGTVQD